jgi:hypothetical protein
MTTTTPFKSTTKTRPETTKKPTTAQIPDETVCSALREMKARYGFVNYAAIARLLGCTRQNVVLRVKALQRKGAISPQEYVGYIHKADYVTELRIKVSNENLAFLNNMESTLGMTRVELVNAALDSYRRTP